MQERWRIAESILNESIERIRRIFFASSLRRFQKECENESF